MIIQHPAAECIPIFHYPFRRYLWSPKSGYWTVDISDITDSRASIISRTRAASTKLEPVREKRIDSLTSPIATPIDSKIQVPKEKAQMAGPTFRRLYLSNLDERTSVADIKSLFGLEVTEFLKKNSFVDIKKNEGKGEVIVPSDLLDDFLKYNGMEMYGRKISVQTEEGASNDNNRDVQTNIQNESDDILYMFLDCRRPEWNKDHVNDGEVCDALLEIDDPLKTVKTLRNSMIGTFRIESSNFALYVDKKVTIRNVELPLVPVRKFKNGDRQGPVFSSRPRHFDPDGVMVTIYDAYELQYHGISHEQFDNYFIQMGVDVIKPTQPQRCRKRRDAFNTNRYLVVKNVNPDGTSVDMGDRIVIEGKTFKLNYYGIQKYCFYCATKHGRECPKKIRFDFLRELRKGKTEKRKVYADSTMRYTNQLALSTDVACMSGGGIGQLCNWIPFDDHHEEVVISGGTNEIHSSDPLQEFVYTITKAADKLTTLVQKHNITVVIPQCPENVPELIGKAQYLEEKLKAVEGIQTVKLDNIDLEDERHPSPDGTLRILDQLDAATNNEMFLPDCREDAVLKMKYRQVQPVYKVGCRGCDSMDFTATLCETCKRKAKEVNVEELQQKIETIRNELFPSLDIDMKLIQKRTFDASDNDGSPSNPKKFK